MSRAPPFDYSVFGLRVRSEIELPELFPADNQGESDVTITLGTIDSPQHEPGLHQLGDGLLFVAKDAARYKIAGGRQITIDPNHVAPDTNVRLFLLGSAFGALLHQRGLLPLHANAVEIEGKAVAFMGESGAGKSTLAAWFHDRGHLVLADDVCVACFSEEGQPFARAGLPRLRLWIDAIEQSGREVNGFSRSYVGGVEQLDKFDVPLRSGDASPAAMPLVLLYALEWGETFAVAPVTGLEAAEIVFDHTYRGGYLAAAGGQKTHWEAATKLVRSCSIFRVTRQCEMTALDAEAGRLLDHARAAIRNEVV